MSSGIVAPLILRSGLFSFYKYFSAFFVKKYFIKDSYTKNGHSLTVCDKIN